ncbi:hypothetical protein COU20_02945 [Candidatus Kaiserbacteria bacterium CG10_big_fil_rev_8_21_14_0_10_59_10]|uniref:Uncharacterized protein n=1 Tax=Candidatus Kaiserbacteria bacterium CG10_big_fil_rev_8_21_14_0_10_59_10 TaxID=1974612 RepID=A0A2H0U9J3_9BACT|nr:MAG: hypothetical protein COU20_02945 [Candidatus Kaiserbacteria bacterium CG10_big_fil_rev_8_21_14_0_10_59_10]
MDTLEIPRGSTRRTADFPIACREKWWERDAILELTRQLVFERAMGRADSFTQRWQRRADDHRVGRTLQEIGFLIGIAEANLPDVSPEQFAAAIEECLAANGLG